MAVEAWYRPGSYY